MRGHHRAQSSSRRAPASRSFAATGGIGGRRAGAAMLLARDILGDARGKDHGFEQRVRRQPVGAVRAGRRYFAAGPQSLQRGAAVRVDGDAAHVIMRGRRDRDRLRRRIDAGGDAARIDGREISRRNARRAPRARRGTRRGRRRSRRTRRARRCRAARARPADGRASMKRSPASLIRVAPSPRSASVASGAGSRPTMIAVGWNWTNSGSAITAPARAAIASPRPLASAGLVVTA